MTRPGLCASRSSTVQRTDAPVETSVTVTTVPNAKVGLAQVPARAPYHDASPIDVRPGAGADEDTTGLGARTTGVLGVTTADTDTAATGFGAGAGGAGADVVVVVGSACRNETLTMCDWGPTSVATDPVSDDSAPDEDDGRARSVKAAGVVHDVDRRASASSARPGATPAWCLRPCNVARCGVASRRSGTSTRARQHPS